MDIDTNITPLTRQLAGTLPVNTAIIGRITSGDRSQAVLIRNNATGIYSTMIAQAVRSIDQRTAKAAHFVALRSAQALTQQQAAAIIGVTVKAVEHWEQGRRTVPQYAINALSR